MTIETFDSTEYGYKPFLSVYLEMDDEVKTVSRKLMTFMDALKNAGGFMSVICVVALTLVQYLQKTIYFTSLIKSLFKYQKLKISKGSEITKQRNKNSIFTSSRNLI